MGDVFFGTDEIRLHGVYMASERPGAPAAVLCHPHPQYGGSMNNNVVLGIETVLNDSGYTTLRFNFRGVGRSEGSFDDGRGECRDVISAVDFLAADSVVGQIHIVGYSFGAIVGLKAGINDDRVASLSAIAPPTVMDSFDFLTDNDKPVLMVAGSQDDFCDVKALEQTILSSGGKIELIPGADHFLMSSEHKAGNLIKEFLDSFEKQVRARPQ